MDVAVSVEPLIGAFVIGVLTDGLIRMGVSTFWQQVIKGSVIVFAVIIDQVQARMQENIALQKQQEELDRVRIEIYQYARGGDVIHNQQDFFHMSFFESR